MSLNFIQENQEYTQDVYSLVLDQYANKEYYIKFIDLLINIQKDFQRLLVELATSRRLPLAEGEQLTEIGRQLGITRTTDDDNDFRAAIYLSSVKRTADGTRDSIASALQISTGEYPYLYSGLYHSVDVTINGDIYPSFETVDEVVNLLPVNTNYRILKSPINGSKPFGFYNNTHAGGMASKFLSDTTGCGAMCSKLTQTPTPRIRTGLALPYVEFGYVEVGYVGN